MPLVEYVLLAILGSAGAAIPGGAPGTPRTFGADAVVQPSGGTGLGQTGGGSTDTTTPPKTAVGKKATKTHTSRRHHRRGHKGGKVTKPIEGSRNAQRKI